MIFRDGDNNFEIKVETTTTRYHTTTIEITWNAWWMGERVGG